MSGFESARAVTMLAAAAVTQYRLVKIGTNGVIAAVAAEGVDVIGVALESRSTDDITDGNIAVPVALLDGAKLQVEAGEAIVISGGAVPLKVDSVGRVAAATSANDRVIGYALEAASGAGVIIQMISSKYAGQYATGFGWVCIAAGEFATLGGDANESITVAGAVAADVSIVTVNTVGATPRTVLSSNVGTDAIAVVMSGDPSTDHRLNYAVFRAA